MNGSALGPSGSARITRSGGAYANLEDFLGAVAEILREEVDELVRLGATYVQLDAPQYPLLVDPTYRDFYASRGWPADRWLELGLELGLEQAMEFCSEDECVEVTPEVVRVREVELDATSRARSRSRAKARANS